MGTFVLIRGQPPVEVRHPKGLDGFWAFKKEDRQKETPLNNQGVSGFMFVFRSAADFF